MGDLLHFPTRDDNDKLKSNIEKSIKTTKNIRKNHKDMIEDDLLLFDYFEGYASNILNKVKKGGFKSRETLDRYYEVYDHIKTSDNHKIDKNLYSLVLLYITDQYSKAIYNDFDYLDSIIDSIIDFSFDKNTINNEVNNKFLKFISLPMIKEVILHDENNFIRENMYDIIEMISQGYDPSSIVNEFINTPKIDDLKTGFIDIDRLQNYYLTQLDLFMGILNSASKDSDLEKYIDIFNKMTIINSYDSKYKTLYIYCINQIAKNNFSLIDQFKYVKNITEIYLNKSEEYENLNEDNYLDIISSYNSERKKGIKHENR